MIKQTWAEMLRRLAITFPKWVISRLEARSDGKGFAVKAIPLVIVFLSLASITNLAGRAYVHHGDYSAYLTGAGIAVLVPIAVLAAMLIDGKWSYLFWFMALVFAGISGTIQFNIYLLDSTWLSIAEAVAFGYGVPVSEVMLAVMEARLVVQIDDKKAEEAAQAIAVAKAEQVASEAAKRAEEERQAALQREAEDREFYRRKKEAELRAYDTKLQQEAELNRERALAELRIKENKAGAILSRKLSGNTSTIVATPVESFRESFQESIGKQIVRYLLDNPGAKLEDIAGHVGRSVPSVSKEVSALVDADVLHSVKEGRRKILTANGRHEEYLQQS